jgi:diacylglycerol kinase (ATP)
LLIEILNSAIEAVVDRFGDEIHPLAGRAKDMGSAAVLLAFVITALIWFAILI